MRGIAFNLREISGSFADLGIIIPIVIGVVAVSDMRLSPILLFFGIGYIVIGFYFRLPIPVQPMKVIGAVAISNSLSRGEIAVAGIFVGLVFLILGYTKTLGRLGKKVPMCIIRGIQMGVGIMLVMKGGEAVFNDIYIGLISGAIILFFIIIRRDWISIILILFLGLAFGIYVKGIPDIAFNPIMDLVPVYPEMGEIITGLSVAVSQIPMTLMNSVLVISVLVTDLFKRNVEPEKFSRSVGFLNLLTVPFGALPMCHGSGGLAAHYRFGSRTGGSNLVIGGVLIAISLTSSQELLQVLPSGTLGILLIFAGFELARFVNDSDSIPITLVVGVISVLLNVAIGLLLGVAAYYLLKKFRRTGSP